MDSSVDRHAPRGRSIRVQYVVVVMSGAIDGRVVDDGVAGPALIRVIWVVKVIRV
jgi:hypothetical protein